MKVSRILGVLSLFCVISKMEKRWIVIINIILAAKVIILSSANTTTTAVTDKTLALSSSSSPKPSQTILKLEDYVAIGISSGVCAILIILCLVLSGKECSRQQRKDSFNMTGISGDIPSYFHVGLDEYSLTKIPRPQTHYMEQSDEINHYMNVSAGHDEPNLGTGPRPGGLQLISESPLINRSPVPKPRESIKRKDEDRTVIVKRNPRNSDVLEEGLENPNFKLGGNIYDTPSTK